MNEKKHQKKSNTSSEVKLMILMFNRLINSVNHSINFKTIVESNFFLL